MKMILSLLVFLLSITSFVCQKMTPKLRSKILHDHNIRRAKLASGRVTQFNCRPMPTATKMKRLVYDCGLEKSAKNWAKKCQSLKHSNGKHGENLYMVWPAFSLEKVAKNAVEAWWDQELHNLTIPIPKSLDRKFFEHSGAGHFTQMSTDLIHSVGCAGSKCPDDRLLFVCHYDRRQILDKPVYEYGKKCSKCGSGYKCVNMTGLCQLDGSRFNFSNSEMCSIAMQPTILTPKSVTINPQTTSAIKHPLCKHGKNNGGRCKNLSREYSYTFMLTVKTLLSGVLHKLVISMF